jgi:Arm DNA-binding domain
MALSVKKIEKLKSSGRFADGFGLYLQILGPTNRSWLFRYTRAGRERWMGLGPLHTYSLHEARELARKARQQIREGHDPLELRQGKNVSRMCQRILRDPRRQMEKL